MVSHDGIIQGHKVEESTLKELTGLWLANGECVPSLKELLETAKRKTSLKLVLELKAHSKPEREIKAVEEIVSMIKKMGLEPRMIYITFSSHALKDADAALDSLEQQKQAAEVEIAKPFAQEEELQTKSARLAELDALLNMEHQSSRTEPEAEEKPDARPSVLAALEEKADKVEPVRPFKSYLDKDGDAR